MDKVFSWFKDAANGLAIVAITALIASTAKITKLETQIDTVLDKVDNVEELVKESYTDSEAEKDFLARDRAIENLEDRVARLEEKF